MSNQELTEEVHVLNLWAVAGLAVAGLIGFGALFLLPVLQEQGLGTVTAFWIMSAAEGGAAIVAWFSVSRLHTRRV